MPWGIASYRAAKFQFVLSDLLLCTLSILNIGVAPEPVDDVAIVIELRNRSYQEPAILTVEPPDSHFHFSPSGVTRG